MSHNLDITNIIKKVIKISRMEEIEKDVRDVSTKLKVKLNELKNLYKENQCYKEFLKDKKLDEEYLEFRKEFYRNRKWKQYK